jgi:hypothetical protein
VRAPDFIEPVIGYRSWDLIGLRLASRFCTLWVKKSDEMDRVLWDGGALDAECVAGTMQTVFQDYDHPVPHRNCSCGIYAYHDPAEMKKLSHTADVAGAVACWGKVIPHTNGFRAQHAQVVALLAPPVHWRETVVGRVAELLDVPLAKDLGELEEVSLKRGKPVPADLIPQGEYDTAAVADSGDVVRTRQVRLHGGEVITRPADHS